MKIWSNPIVLQILWLHVHYVASSLIISVSVSFLTIYIRFQIRLKYIRALSYYPSIWPPSPTYGWGPSLHQRRSFPGPRRASSDGAPDSLSSLRPICVCQFLPGVENCCVPCGAPAASTMCKSSGDGSRQRKKTRPWYSWAARQYDSVLEELQLLPIITGVRWFFYGDR